MQEDIKLKIQGDTSQVKKDIEKLSKTDVEIKAKLKKPEKNFFKEIEKEANELGKKVSNIKLKKENFSKEQITELKKEIEATALKAKAVYFAEGNKSAKELTDRLKEMHKALSSTKKEMSETKDIFTKMDLIVGNIVSSLALKGASAVKDLIVGGAKFNRELEYADKKIQSISDKSSVEIQSNIGKLSLETGTDPIELRNGLYEIISAVGDVDEAYDLLRTSNKLAITGFTDIGNAVDGLTTVLNAYQMQLSEADRIANIFVKTQKFGKVTVDEFARDLAQSIPYATQLGIKIEEIGSSIALLTSRGVKPAQAETQLSSFLRNILDDNNELAKELNKSFGTSIKEYISNGGSLIKIIEEISNIEKRVGKAITSFSMDSEGKAFILTLKDNIEAYKNFYKEISNTNDEINKNMSNMMNSQQASLNRAKTYWQELSRTIGIATGQIIAYIGDCISGYDRMYENEKLNDNNSLDRLEKTADLLKKMQDGTSLTEGEQKKLNEYMLYFSSFAPEISNAYRNINDEAEKYRSTLEKIVETQKQIENKRYEDEKEHLKRNITLAEREIKKVENKIGSMFQVVDLSKSIDGIGTPQYRNLTYEEIIEKGLPKNATDEQRRKFDKYLAELNIKKSERQSAIKSLNDFYTNKSKADGTYKSPVLETTVTSGKEVSIKPVSKTDSELKTEIEKKYKAEQLAIETQYNNARLKATKTYNEQMSALKGKGTEEEIKAIREAYQKALNRAEYNKDIADINNKMKNTYYSTENEKELNNKYLQSQKDFLKENNLMELEDEERRKLEEERTEAEKKLKESLDNVSSNLRNLSSLFQTIGDNTGSTSIKNLANIGSLGSTIFDTIKNSSQGEALLESVFGKGTEKIAGLENFSMGAGIGSALSGALGGGTEGNIGSTLGSAVGTIVGGPVGSVVGGALGSAVGSVFGRKSKKKKKREERKRRAAQERLKQGMISGQFKWADVLQEYNEDLQRAGMGEYIGLLDKVSVNTDYDNVRSILNGAKRGADGVSMSALKQLMPQYTESQIMDWFKSITGGAVLNGDTLSTGEGKYGAIDISALAQQVTNANREMEQSLKETIKNIIDFSADSLAQVVKEGFFDGLDNLGDNIEKMIANSLKNAFLNTEISKNLFNGLSDKVAEYIKDMFKNDKNLGLDLETGNLEKLTFTQYIELIKKYMEMSNDKLEELFKELGLNMDNLTESMDSLNKNMSKNVVSGIATNLWKQNLGIKEPYKINQNIHLEIPVTLNGKEMDRYIIKTVNGSLQRSRRSGNGIGRG